MTNLALVKELIASQLSRVATLLLQFLTAPLVAHAVGPANYGLVALYVTLIAFLTFLTQASSSIATRILSPWPNMGEDERRLTRRMLSVLELQAVATGLAACAVLLLASPFTARHWLKMPDEAHGQTVVVLMLMSLSIAAQWLHPFFTAGFSARHAQHVIAVPFVVFSLAQNLGAVALLYGIAPRLELYFAWNATAWAAYNCYCHRQLAVQTPAVPAPASAALEALKGHLRFGLSVTAFALLNSLFTQVDKLVVSYATDLAAMAAYVMSFTMASPILALAATPVGSVLMPIISRHTSEAGEARLAEDYHRWTQVLMVLALPPAAALIAFPEPLAALWLGASSPLAPKIAQILPWASASTLLTAIAAPLLLLQWGRGWTSLSVAKMMSVLPIYLAALWICVPRYGAVAAAWCSVAIQGLSLAVETPVTHARLLRGEMWRWMGVSVGFPLAASAVLYATAAPLLRSSLTGPALVAAAGGLAVVHAGMIGLLLPHTRGMARGVLQRVGVFSASR